jgi:hypothetical protein
LTAVALAAATACSEPPREPLRQVYSPPLTRVPPPQPFEQTVTTLARDWRGAPGETLRADLISWQGITVVLALAVILTIAFDTRRPRRGVLIDLLLMFAAGACLFDVMRFFDHLNDRAYVDLLDWVFIAVFALTAALMLRSLWRAWKDAPTAWRPNLRRGVLGGLAVALLLLDGAAVMTRPPDDAGFFVNLGAQRLRERGRLPYGDPLLTATPGAAYAPLVYVAHVPFQVLVAPKGMNETSPDSPQLGGQSTYYLPPLAASQLCALTFHLIGVAALFFAARRLAGADVGLAVVCLYCGSLAVLGIGSDRFPVAGITFVSHIAPASIVLLAFAALPSPALAGALLVAAAGTGFYPAFMGPAWLGYYWRDRHARYRFIAACLVVSVALLAFVFALSRPADGLSTMGTFLRDSFGHHTDPAGYGSSPFGFWGQKGGIRQAIITPLLSSPLTSAAWVAFFALIAASGLLAKGRSPAALALLSGAIAMAATLVKPHASGTYMAWYYGLILIGICAGGPFVHASAPEARPPERSGDLGAPASDGVRGSGGQSPPEGQ